MKNFRYSHFIAKGLLGLTLLAGTASCSESFFDKYPTDSMQMETYMKNDGEVENIMLDAYYYLRTITENLIYVSEIGTDVAYNYKGNNSTDHINLNECNWDVTMGITPTIWTECFNVINRSNSVLEKLASVSNPAKKTQLEGEAHFFRAYAYFTLVRLFGPVPLTEHTITDYAQLYDYPRESTDNVYSLIQKDLENAIAHLPDAYQSANESGRATRLAAYMMQAEMQMTRKDFAGARASLDYLINYAAANPAKLGLEADVKSVYDSQNFHNKEVLFAAQFNYGSTPITNPLMGRAIRSGDPSSQPSFIYADGSKSTIRAAEGTSVLLMTWELYNKLKASVGDTRFSELTYAGISDARSTNQASAEVEVTKDGYAYIPMTLKYYDFHNQGLAKCNSGNDNIIYRYADALLMYAECLNETGESAKAVGFVNQVRQRAHAVPVTSSLSQADLRQVIEDERLLELCFEGHRWFDLLRTGRLTPVMIAHFNHRTPGLGAEYQACDNGMVVEGPASIQPKSTARWRWEKSDTPVLFPIPYDQHQLMRKWEQNEAYQ